MKTTPNNSKQVFRGDKKNLVHFLVPYEKKFLEMAVPRVPKALGTVQLTMMTILWSSGIVLAGYWAVNNILWLWLFSSCIFMQYVTDMLDGAVGRARKTGLIKWGFYMDHFLDYVFLASIIIGYSFMLPANYSLLVLLCLALSAGFMVHAMMDFSITNNFKISCNYFGVSELRWVLIIFNTAMILFGKQLLPQVFPYFVAAAFIALGILVYKSQKVYRHLDALQQSQEEQEDKELYAQNIKKYILS